MRKLTRSLLLAGGLALTSGAIGAPALADFGFSLNLGGPGHYHAPPPGYYYRPHHHLLLAVLLVRTTA
jgi:hypothetical protein